MPSSRSRSSLALLGSFIPVLVEAADDRKSPVSPAEYGKWEVLGAGQLSPDGQWLIHGIVRGDGKNELRIQPRRRRAFLRRSSRLVPRPAFSDDSRLAGL